MAHLNYIPVTHNTKTQTSSNRERGHEPKSEQRPAGASHNLALMKELIEGVVRRAGAALTATRNDITFTCTRRATPPPQYLSGSHDKSWLSFKLHSSQSWRSEFPSWNVKIPTSKHSRWNRGGSMTCEVTAAIVHFILQHRAKCLFGELSGPQTLMLLWRGTSSD